MSGLFLIGDNLANRISYYHLMLLMASMPFNMFYSHLILVSLFLHTLIHLNKNTVKPFFTWRTLVLSSVFIITVLSAIYTVNPPEAFNECGKHITMLLFPLLFCLNPLDISKYRRQLLMAFALVCTATIVYLYGDAIVTIRHYRLPFLSLFSPAFTNHNFSEPIDMHATFFSMQVALSLVYLLSVLIKEHSLYKKIFYITCCIFLTAGIIQLCSKSIFIAVIILVNAVLPYFLLKGAARRKFMIGSAAFCALAIMGIFSSGTLKDRYINELKTDLSLTSLIETTDSRVARWAVVMELVDKSPLIGYGAGSEIGVLQDGFFKHKLYSSYLNRLNGHSQYLSFLLKSGIIGLLFYLGTLAFGFNISFRQKDLLFSSFLALIAIVSLSENLLDVDKGIIFYAFFFSFFVFSNEAPGGHIFRNEKWISGLREKAPVVKEEEYLKLTI